MKHSDEAKAKMSRARKGGKHSAEHRAAISAGNRGKVKTADHVAAVAAALKGKPSSRKGVVLSDETKQRMREAALRRRYSPEMQAVRSAKASAISSEAATARAHKAWETKRAKAQAAAIEGSI